MNTNLASTYVSSAVCGAEVTTLKKIPSVASRLVGEKIVMKKLDYLL